MKLSELLHGVAVTKMTANPDTEISAVCYDSRQCREDALFVAISGFQVDGQRFVPMALEKGAAAILCEKEPEMACDYILVPSARLALAQLGANWYRHPADSMQVIGVTGTNGKTTTTYLLKSLLEEILGAKVGLIGTIQNMIGEEVLHTERTTPESFELQALFARMRDAGCTHVIMEVSSHALVLERVGGIRFRVGAFTNLTEDHLDFHHTMEEYAEAKALLFGRCDRAVINADDDWAQTMTEASKCPVLTYGIQKPAMLRGQNIHLTPGGITMKVCSGDMTLPATLGIPGRFSAYNALTVLGCAVALDIALPDAVRALAKAKGVKGRVEIIPTPGMPFTVLADYAHTPDALENVLKTVRGYCKGRVIAVFGCGGDRDPIKRPIMGKIAVENADFVVVTSDNPRTEAPMAIISDILKGLEGTETPYVTIENRVEAIHWALSHGEPEDVIVLAGKGHEDYQEINHVKYHLDEREVVAGWLTQRKEG